MKANPKNQNLQDKPIMLGIENFVKISAVEGIALTENSKAMFDEFEASRLPEQERINHILQKHTPKGWNLYQSHQDPYVYKDTNVLINMLGIKDAVKLELFEAEATAFRFTQAMPDGKLDVEHYAAVHLHIFQDVYDWAGEFRTIRIAKGTSMFCYQEYINSEMAKLFNQFGAVDKFAGLRKRPFAEEAATFFASLNAIHPFRDGNGRAQLAFLAIIAHKAGRPINFEKLKPKPFLDAVIKSFSGENKLLEAEIFELL